jgi:hypothetical protein
MNPPSDYEVLVAVCQEKGVDPKILFYPEKHQDDRSTTKRREVIKDLIERGLRIGSIASLCPMDERSIRRVGKQLAFCFPKPAGLIQPFKAPSG